MASADKQVEVSRESTTKTSFQFWQSGQEQPDVIEVVRETTANAQDYFAQDAVQKNMKQSKKFWAAQEEQAKLEPPLKDEQGKKKPGPKKGPPPVKPQPSAAPRPVYTPPADRKAGVEIEKDSIVNNAFGYFQSGRSLKDEGNRQTSEQAQEYLHQEEVKANWSAKTQFWKKEDAKGADASEPPRPQPKRRAKAPTHCPPAPGPLDPAEAQEGGREDPEDEGPEDKGSEDKGSEDEPMLEEDGDDDDDDDVPELEAVVPHAPTQPAEEGRNRPSRSEKKSRKAMQKMGMKPVPGVAYVTIRKARNLTFTISQPDVYKHPASDTYVIFGEAHVEDAISELGKKAVQSFTPEAAHSAAPDVEEDGEMDTSSLDPKDVELVMSQAGVSRNAAGKALLNNDGDIVNAIMELTM